MGTHEGHRDRLKKRFLEHGLDNFNDLNALELLLFYAIPRQDTNELAHLLLDRFDTFAGVIDATPEELRSVKGIGENAVTLLKLIPQMNRRYQISKTTGRKHIQSSEDAGQILVPLFHHAREEIVYLITLDGKRELIACEEIGRGTLDEAHVSIRTIVETALRRNAASVILSHNHVDGIALPSRADAQTTETIRQALRYVGITLSDHIIVAGDDYVSFADSGLLGMPFTG